MSRTEEADLTIPPSHDLAIFETSYAAATSAADDSSVLEAEVCCDSSDPPRKPVCALPPAFDGDATEIECLAVNKRRLAALGGFGEGEALDEGDADAPREEVKLKKSACVAGSGLKVLLGEVEAAEAVPFDPGTAAAGACAPCISR